MDLARALPYVEPFVRARWLGGRVPLVVGIQITNRCNLRCAYCTRWSERPSDLDSPLLADLFRELVLLGTRRIVLTGGEPLVRPDLRGIVASARAAGLAVGVNTNGTLVAGRLDAIEGIRDASLSLDGVGQAHDRLRGAGSFEGVSKAAEELRRLGVRVRYTVVLHKTTVGEIDRLLALAGTQGIPILFQPLFNPAPDSERWEAPVEEYRAAVDLLISRKRNAAGRVVANSLAGLEYLRGWPHPPRGTCAAGILFCRIQANGDVVLCAERPEPGGNVVAVGAGGFQEAFRRLPVGSCGTCPCANHVEINQVFQLRLEAGRNLLRLL